MEKAPHLRRVENLSPPTPRPYEEYMQDLHLNRADIEGRKVLDVGAGAREFAKGAEREGIETTIISLDPHYADMDEWREVIHKGSTPNVEALTVAAVGERLPFRDETFDLVVADNSLPFYSRNRAQLKSYFQELRRVVKVGGEVRIYPANAMGLMDLLVGWEIIKLRADSDFSVEKEDKLLIFRKK